MTRRPWLIAVSAVVATLTMSRVAYANVISPFVYFWPGIISITIIYAFPASLLAAFVEEPFLRRCGVERCPLAASLQANFLTTIVGLVLIPIGYPALYTIGPLWCIAAFSISCFVELRYLRWATGEALNRGWIVIGNAVSAAILMTLPPVAYALGQSDYRLAWSMRSHGTWLAWTAFTISAVVFLLSFARSTRRTPATSNSEPDGAHELPLTAKSSLEPAAKTAV